VEYGAEPGAGGVAVDHELPLKVRHLQNRAGGERPLQRRKSLRCFRGPGEGLLAQEASQGAGDGPEVPDELPVVSGESQKAADAPSRAGLRPGRHSLHLGAVYGDAPGRDDVAEVGDRAGPEGALGVLEVEVVGAERVEEDADVLQVLGP